MAPPKFGSRIGSTVRSGLNLPIASASDPFSALTRPASSEWTSDFATAPGIACSTASRWSSSKAAMMPAEPGGNASPILSRMPDSSLLLGELADNRARRCAHGDRREQRRREQADEHADATAPAGSLAADVIARVGHRDVAVRVVGDEDDPLDPDLLGADELGEDVEVAPGDVDVGVCRRPGHRCAVRPRRAPWWMSLNV